MNDFKVISVNTSEQMGTANPSVNQIAVSLKGIPNDAHAGDWHRQGSLLAIAKNF